MFDAYINMTDAFGMNVTGVTMSMFETDGPYGCADLEREDGVRSYVCVCVLTVYR